jgi:hypothetical protein
LGEEKMPDYQIEINKLLKKGKSGTIAEIWAKITDVKTHQTINKRIWWQGDDGVYHDETPELPAEIRGAVDNAWIEESRKW